MPIAFPITLPFSTKTSTIVTFMPQAAVSRKESSYSYVSQMQKWAGQRMGARISVPPMARADAEEWVASLLSLNGKEGSFYLGDPANKTPRGSPSGTPLVKGASQTGQDLITDGWTISITNILRKGDWIQIGTGSSSRLHKMLLNANSDGLGESTLTLWPDLRAPADNAAIITSSPVGVFELVNNFEWSVDVMHKYGFEFAAQERI